MILRAAPSLVLALFLAACGGSDGGGTTGGDIADIVVMNAGPAEVQAGEAVEFVATVANEGPADATNVTITHRLEGAPAVGSMTCAATGGASCPATLGASMKLARLPVGGGLVFHIEVPGDPNRAGALTSSITAQAAADTNHDNNVGEATTIALDLRNGDYTVFGSNGRPYTLTLNFNELSYEWSGQQMSVSGSFTRDPDGVTYTFDGLGTAHFRTTTDLVVGGFNFNLDGSDHPYDHGVRPFVGARRFVTHAADLVGQTYNQIGLNLRRNNLKESRVLPSSFGDGVMHVCNAPTPVRVDQCPAQYLADYELSVNAGLFTGVLRSNGDVIDAVQFRVALSGTQRILLRAQDAFDETGRHFRVGVLETDGLAGGSFGASSTRAAWGTTTLSDTRYSFSGTITGGDALVESADLAPLVAGAPTGLRIGARGDGAQIFLAQNVGLYLMLGERGGAAEGTMDVGLQ